MGRSVNGMAAFLAIFALAIPAMAAAQSIIVLGPGAISCGKYVEYRRDSANPISENMSLGDLVWVLGYLTAYNNYVSVDGNITANTDSSGIQLWVDNYCQAHPLDSLSSATSALIAELRARKN